MIFLKTYHSPTGEPRDDRTVEYRPVPVPGRAAGVRVTGFAAFDVDHVHEHPDVAEADAVCGAPYGESSPERTNVRNGYRHRDFDTRAGTLDVAIPKLREGSYFPDSVNDRRERAGRV